MLEPLTDERIALNDATFRRANEEIRAAAETYDVTDSVPFICECADPSCRDIVRLSLEAYEEIRADGTVFFKAAGHEIAGAEATQVIERRDGYVIVRKQGKAAKIAEELDPRTTAHDG